MHVLLIAKQPPERLMPLDAVEVAAPVRLRFVVWSPDANVDVAAAFEVMIPLLSILKSDVVALAVDDASEKSPLWKRWRPVVVAVPLMVRPPPATPLPMVEEALERIPPCKVERPVVVERPEIVSPPPILPSPIVDDPTPMRPVRNVARPVVVERP